MDKTSAKADALGKKTPTVKVGADTTAADADLDKTSLKADTLGRKTETVTVKADTSDVSKKISDLTDGPFSLLKTAIVGLGPAAVPVLGAVTAAVLPLSAAIGSAATGLGAFGVVSKLVLTQAGTAAVAVKTAQVAYNAAIAAGTKQSTAYATEQQAIAIAYAGMSRQQVTLAQSVGSLIAGYKQMLTSVTPLVSSALVPWMKDVQGLLVYIKPLITPVADLFRQWGTELGQALTGNAAKISAFIDAFAGRSADNIRNFGDALKFFAEAAGALVHDIGPSLDGASVSIARLAASFDGWAHSQSAADDIKGFFAWAKAEAPVVKQFLDSLAGSVGNLVKAMAFAGGGDLKVLTVALSAIAALPPAAIVAIADGYVALSLGLRAASGAMAIWNGVSAAAKVIQAALNTEVEATGAALALQTIFTLAQAAATAVMDAAETVYIALMLAADAASLPVAVVIGAIVLAVAALGIGIYELVTNWTTVWHAILAAAQDVWGWIKANWPLLGAILLGPVAVAVLEIVQHWNTVKDAFSAVSAWIAADWNAFTAALLAPVTAVVHAVTVAWQAIEAPFAAVCNWIAAHWQDVLVLLTGLIGVAILVIIHFWPQIQAAVEAVFNAIASFFTSWWASETSQFTAAANVVKTVLSAAWNAISAAAKAAWGAIAAFFTSWWNSEVAYFRGPVTAIENALTTAWAAIASVAKTAWSAISSYFASWWNGELSSFKSAAAAIGTALSAAWNGIETAAKSVFGAILTFFGGFWAALKSGFASAVSGVATAWDKLESIVKTPVQWVVTNVYDKLIVPFWNATAGAIGLTKLPKLASGGIVPGGYSRADNQLVWMRSGEGVLQPGAVSALGGPGFIHWANRTYGDVPAAGPAAPGHYALGGLIPSPGQLLHDVGGTFTSAWDAGLHLGGNVLKLLSEVTDVRQWLKLPLEAVEKAIDAVIGAVPGSGGMVTWVKDAGKKIVDTWIGKLIGGTTGSGTAGPVSVAGNVISWLTQAIQDTGVPMSWLTGLEIIAAHESGGNPDAINLTDSNAAAGDPSRGLMQCLTIDAVILTRRGWLKFDEVFPGDETIGYNPVSGRSEWTRVTKVVRYEDGEVWRIGGKGWHAKVTPNHRWWSDSLVHDRDAFASCPECGWLPKGTRRPSRGVQVHRMKIHGAANEIRPNSRLRGEFVRTDHLTSEHRLRLAAVADTDGIPGLSLDECRIIAWLQGDGHISSSRPGSYDGRIFQAKPVQVTKIRALLARVEHTEVIRPGRKAHHLPGHTFTLRRAYVTDVLKRSEVMETGPEAFVLRLSPDQRAAWLDSMIDAEGHRQPGKKPGHSEFIRIAQVNGPLQDAIKLAVYLEGYRPTFSANSAERNGYQPAALIGMAGPHVAPSMFAPHEVLDDQPVWCVKTDLETWTARQDGQVFLTGNTIMATFDAYHQSGTSWDIYDPVANAAAAIDYIKAVYGTIGNVPGVAAVEAGGSYVGYDSGGWLQPGATFVNNTSGRPEPVLSADQWDMLGAAAGSGGLGDKLDRIAGLLASQPRATASGISEVLNGTAHTAAFQRRYPRNR